RNLCGVGEYTYKIVTIPRPEDKSNQHRNLQLWLSSRIVLTERSRCGRPTSHRRTSAPWSGGCRGVAQVPHTTAATQRHSDADVLCCNDLQACSLAPDLCIHSGRAGKQPAHRFLPGRRMPEQNRYPRPPLALIVTGEYW